MGYECMYLNDFTPLVHVLRCCHNVLRRVEPSRLKAIMSAEKSTDRSFSMSTMPSEASTAVDPEKGKGTVAEDPRTFT